MQVKKVNYTQSDAAEKFVQSLLETGFAVITNHPISSELVHATFKDWENFFNSNDKQKYLFDVESQEGYFPFRSENAKDYSVKDLKEFFHCYASTKLAQMVQKNTKALFSQMNHLAIELLGWIDQQTPEKVKNLFSMPLSQMIQDSQDTLLRPIHYPPLTGEEEPGAIRAAAHEDINLITILPAATAPGLQVKDNDGIWHNVACDPGSLAINSGDMLQMASGGYYRSTTHRVINPEESASDGSSKKPRYSMPLFLHPRPEVLLSKTMTAGEYKRNRLKEIGLIKGEKKGAS